MVLDKAVILAAGSLIASVAGTVTSAVQQQRAASFNEAVARQRAERERQIAELQAKEFARDAERLKARQRAIQGTTGTQIGSGTSLLVQEDTAAEAAFQEQLILAGGTTRSQALESSTRLSRLQRQQALIGGISGVGQTLLAASKSPLFGSGTGGVDTSGPELLKFRPASSQGGM